MKLRSGFNSSRAWYSKDCEYCSLDKGLLCTKHEALLPNTIKDARVVAGRYRMGVECNQCVDSGIACSRCVYIALLRGSRHPTDTQGRSLRTQTLRCLKSWVCDYNRHIRECVLVMKTLTRVTQLPLAIVRYIVQEFLGVDMYDPSEWAAYYNIKLLPVRFRVVKHNKNAPKWEWHRGIGDGCIHTVVLDGIEFFNIVK